MIEISFYSSWLLLASSWLADEDLESSWIPTATPTTNGRRGHQLMNCLPGDVRRTGPRNVPIWCPSAAATSSCPQHIASSPKPLPPLPFISMSTFLSRSRRHLRKTQGTYTYFLIVLKGLFLTPALKRKTRNSYLYEICKQFNSDDVLGYLFKVAEFFGHDIYMCFCMYYWFEITLILIIIVTLDFKWYNKSTIEISLLSLRNCHGSYSPT